MDLHFIRVHLIFNLWLKFEFEFLANLGAWRHGGEPIVHRADRANLPLAVLGSVCTIRNSTGTL